MRKLVRGPLLAAAILAGIAGIPLGYAFAQASSPNEIVGVWEAENGSLKFEIFDAGGIYAGRMIFGDRVVEADGKTFKKDTLNPDPKLRSRSLKGIVFVNNLKWDAADRRWEGGSLYDGSSGRTYSGRATLVNGKLELRGYVGTPVLGQTMLMRRVQ